MNILCMDTSGKVLNFSLLKLPDIIYPDATTADSVFTASIGSSASHPSERLHAGEKVEDTDKVIPPETVHSVVDVLKGELQINSQSLSASCIPKIPNYTVAPSGVFTKRYDVGGKMNETLFSSLNQFLEECELQVKDIDEWVSILGPGSLTGIRVGLAALAGITVGLGKPLYGLSAFDAVALIYDMGRKVHSEGSKVTNCARLASQRLLVGGEYMPDMVEICAKLRQREYACRTYNSKTGSMSEIVIKEIDETAKTVVGDDIVDRLLINSGNNSSAGIYLSEAIFHSKVRDYYMEPTPMYVRRSEAELNFDKSSNKR